MSRIDTVEVAGAPPMRVGVAIPDGAAGRRPGIVVMVHGPGLDTFIHAQVDDLARHGYVAAAPDVFHRQPDDGTAPLVRVGRLLDRELVDDVDATVAHLRTLPEVDPDRLAILGFCMGGRNTLLLAAARPAWWRCAGVFYGGRTKSAWGDGPSPFDRLREIRCPILGQFGADDVDPSPDDVRAIDAALTEHGVQHEFHTYAGAGHAFLNFTNAERHRPAQAAEAWAKMLAFLDRTFAA